MYSRWEGGGAARLHYPVHKEQGNPGNKIHTVSAEVRVTLRVVCDLIARS